MRAYDHDIMYADKFISYLPHNVEIEIYGGVEAYEGSKDSVLNWLEEKEQAGKKYVLSDTSAVYLSDGKFIIYIDGDI